MAKDKKESGEAPGRKFRVQLNAKTPLRAAVLDVQAADENEAWEKFCQHNGIGGSDCERYITKVD